MASSLPNGNKIIFAASGTKKAGYAINQWRAHVVEVAFDGATPGIPLHIEARYTKEGPYLDVAGGSLTADGRVTIGDITSVPPQDIRFRVEAGLVAGTITAHIRSYGHPDGHSIEYPPAA